MLSRIDGQAIKRTILAYLKWTRSQLIIEIRGPVFVFQNVGHIARDCRVVKKAIPASQSSVKAMYASVKSDECITLAHERVGEDQRVTIDNGSRGVQTR